MHGAKQGNYLKILIRHSCSYFCSQQTKSLYIVGEPVHNKKPEQWQIHGRDLGVRNVGRFANESFRQRSFRKRLRSVRKYLWSVRKRVEVSSQTLSTFICVEASSVLISDVNIWPYKLTLKPSLVVDFALSQRLRIACTIAVIRKSIYRYETGLTVVVFYQEAFLLRSTNSERPDKNASIFECNRRDP